MTSRDSTNHVPYTSMMPVTKKKILCLVKYTRPSASGDRLEKKKGENTNQGHQNSASVAEDPE